MQQELLAHFQAQPGLCLGTRPPTNSILPSSHYASTCNLQQEVRMACPVARPCSPFIHSIPCVHCDLY